MLHYNSLERLANDKHSSLLSHFVVTNKVKCKILDFRGRIHNTLFLCNLRNVHRNLECYVTLKWKVLPVRNTLAYCQNLLVTKEINCFEYDTRDKHFRLLGHLFIMNKFQFSKYDIRDRIYYPSFSS